MPVKDISGQRFGILTVIERDTSKIGGAAYWKCQCDCGNICSVRGNNLRSGKKTSCGCQTKIQYRKNNIDTTSQIGKRYGRLVVKERDLSKPIGHGYGTYWICKCDCGNTISVAFNSLSTGKTQSCGCLHSELVAKNNYKDITNQRFGRLVAKENTWVLSNHNSYIWRCECDCGNTDFYCPAEVLLNNNTQSCGCVTSKGEFIIKQILQDNNIPFNQQFSFPDLRSKKNYLLRFDFIIYNTDNSINRLVEFDGEQHYNEDTFFSSKNLIENDKRKNEYAKTHNIPLVRIPYSELNNLSLELILGDKYLI